MEIRTVGNLSVGSRPAADGGTFSQLTQEAASGQTAVQTAKAVPQVADPGQMGMTRKPADMQDVRPQLREGGQPTGAGLLARGMPARERAVADRPRQAQQNGQSFSMTENATAREVQREQAQRLLNDISSSLPLAATNLNLAVDEDLGRVVVKIVDSETQEVIKQIPSEEALALAKSLSKLKGMFVETKA